MSNRKAIVVIGLGFGDEGKGTTVEAAVQRFDADLVIRFNGGFQAAHNVHLADGRHHTFSQFGSGTFQGARTLLTQDVIVNPLAMELEAKLVGNKLGLDNPMHSMNLMYVNTNCLVTTPYHRALNQVRELSRIHAHGSTGTGIGETVRYGIEHPASALTVAHLLKDADSLTSQLQQLSRTFELKCLEIIHDFGLNRADVDLAMSNFVFDPRDLAFKYKDWTDKVTLNNDYMERRMLRTCRNSIVFEGAQGMLLDKRHGFHPYTTWSSVSDQVPRNLIPDDNGYEIQTIGVTRTFMTRHGHGPLMSEHTWKCKCASDDDNQREKFQGHLRTGDIDLCALEYAASKLVKLDGLVVTHCDKFTGSENEAVTGYEGIDLLSYNAEEASLEAFKFTEKLKKAKRISILTGNISECIEQRLKVPVVMRSFGKTFEHKKFYGRWIL